MIRHILFWNYTEKVKEKHGEEEALRFMQDSVATLTDFCRRKLERTSQADTTLSFMPNLQTKQH